MNTKMKLLLWRVKNYPFVSIGIVVINFIVFLLCMIFPQIYEKGYNGIYQVLLQKEYGRVVWSTFLHSDAGHIFNNMIIVLFMGSMLEEKIGHWFYGGIYFLAGIGGNLLSLLVNWWHEDYTISLGASGAVFGLDGLLLAMILFMGSRMNLSKERVIIVVFLSLYSGFQSTGIDNAAHVGGLITGFLLGIPVCILCERNKKRRLWK